MGDHNTMAETSTPFANNNEIKEAISGLTLITPVFFLDLAQFFESANSDTQRQSWIRKAFARLHELSGAVDSLTVCQEPDRAGKLTVAGGWTYSTALVKNASTSLHQAHQTPAKKTTRSYSGFQVSDFIVLQSTRWQGRILPTVQETGKADDMPDQNPTHFQG
jgi:hypothetical protein